MRLIHHCTGIVGALWAERAAAQSTSQTLTVTFELIPVMEVPLSPYAPLAIAVVLGTLAAVTLRARVGAVRETLRFALAVVAAGTLALYPSVAWVQAAPFIPLQLALSSSPVTVVVPTVPQATASGYNIAVSNPHAQSVRLTSVVLTLGTYSLVPGGNACRVGTVLPPGGSCPSVAARPFS